jgi:phosphoglucosamine mutase
LDSLKQVISECETSLGKEGRTVVRYSGTENMIRILVEAHDQKDVDTWIDAISAVVKKELC